MCKKLLSCILLFIFFLLPTGAVFANGMEIATVTGIGASSTPHYVPTDNLLGSSVTTSASGAQEEMVDYLPYGSIRLNEKSGTYTDQRKYSGSEYDTESGLNYMNARYYDGGFVVLGKFENLRFSR